MPVANRALLKDTLPKELFETREARIARLTAEEAIPGDHLRCTKCKEILHFSKFNKCNTSNSGRQGGCMACRRKIHKAKLAADPELKRQDLAYYREWTKNNKDSRQRTYYKYEYGLSKEELDILLAQPCEICGSTEKICVDHDHDTEAVRGTLCGYCNSGIGYFKEDPAILLAAIEYLRKHGK